MKKKQCIDYLEPWFDRKLVHLRWAVTEEAINGKKRTSQQELVHCDDKGMKFPRKFAGKFIVLVLGTRLVIWRWRHGS